MEAVVKAQRKLSSLKLKDQQEEDSESSCKTISYGGTPEGAFTSSQIALFDEINETAMHQQYKVKELIGEGVEGSVFSAKKVSTGETVIIKAIKRFLGGTYCAK